MGSDHWPSTFRSRKKVEEPKEEDEDEEETFWILKKFTVFNANQVSGAAAEQFQSVEQPDTDRHSEPDYEPAEELIQATGADIRHRRRQSFLQLPIHLKFPISLAWHHVSGEGQENIRLALLIGATADDLEPCILDVTFDTWALIQGNR